MKKFDPQKIAKNYSFTKRSTSGQAAIIQKRLPKRLTKTHLLLIGFGGTISSGYTPARETIVPLHPSPAIKQIDYVNLFGVSGIKYDRFDFLAKDSREITDEDINQLLDVIHTAPNHEILITAGTYMLPKIAETIARACAGVEKVVVLTGSILPAGFVASDADANVWSAITLIDYLSQAKGGKGVYLTFHGRVFSTVEEFRVLNLHPESVHNMVIQYPLSSVPIDGVL